MTGAESGAGEVLVAAVVAQLRLAGLTAFDAPPVRAGVPYAVVEDPVLADWSTKSWKGREGRLAVVLHDEGERPVRLRTLMARVETAMAVLPGDLGGGWRVAQVLPVRSRVAKAGGDRWRGTGEFTVRIMREV